MLAGFLQGKKTQNQSKNICSIEMQTNLHFNKIQHQRQNVQWSCRLVLFGTHLIVHHGLIPHFLELQQFKVGRNSKEVQLYYAFWQPILFPHSFSDYKR